jgi:hypothetical protein
LISTHRGASRPLTAAAPRDPPASCHNGSPESSLPPRFAATGNRDYTVMNPLASVQPAVVPGEKQVGKLPDEQPIWHYQDDGVAGAVIVMDPTVDQPCDEAIEQYGFAPTRYIDGLDGPGPVLGADFSGISRFSKDLAFELYAAVPEPSTLLLSAIALMGLVIVARRR